MNLNLSQMDEINRLKIKVAAARKEHGDRFSSSECTSDEMRELAWVIDLFYQTEFGDVRYKTMTDARKRSEELLRELKDLEVDGAPSESLLANKMRRESATLWNQLTESEKQELRDISLSIR